MAAPDPSSARHHGGCLCRAVRFEIIGAMAPVTACHCLQCRKSSGHYWASTRVADGALAITEARGLRWHRSSAGARRGFCRTCGSSLFWRADGSGTTAVAAGSLDAPTGLGLARHIFVAEKGDYYEIADGLPQSALW